MKEIKVSVIIPIYNVEEYLEACLDSVAEQTLKELQVIMVDDGSLDGSSDIARSYAEKYDNFLYVRQKNGGLGNARNTGIKYAEGKYIIFLDSDDIVPDYAYERMYLAAERNQSDMVVGHVCRLKGERDVISNLQEIAFQKFVDKTHIKENPHLIYDTTSWNKLIRKDFWEKYGFRFPERILYEDIPVTIPMHYLANNVTVVQDVCYQWRIRDGANKSITQRADDFKNLRDRIAVLRMVDKFFKENVKEENLWEAKHYKWLFIDMKIFMNTCLYLTDEQALKMMHYIKDYIEEAIPVETIEKLPVMAREEYRALMDLDVDRLMRLRRYELDNFNDARITKRNGKYVGHFPKDLISKDHSDMTSALAERRMTRIIQRVDWVNDKCIVEGYVFMMGIPVPNTNKQKLQAYLCRLDTGEKIPVQTEGVKSPEAQERFKFKLDTTAKQLYYRNYKGAGYRITIDVNNDIIKNNLNGEYHLLMSYESEDWKREFVLRGFAGKLEERLPQKTYFKDHLLIQLKSMHRHDLKFDVQRHNVEIEKKEILNGVLRLNLSEKVDNIYAASGYHSGEQLSAEIEGNQVLINLKDLPDQKMYIAVKKKNRFVPVFCENKERTFSEDNGIQLIEEIPDDYQYYIFQRKAVPVLKSLQQKGEAVFEAVIAYHADNLPQIPVSSVLYVEEQLIEDRIILDETQTEKQGEEYIAKFTIDLGREEIVKDLYAKKRQIFIEYTSETGDRMEYEVKGCDETVDVKYFDKKWRYRLVIDPETDGLSLNTMQLKEFWTKGPKKRALLNKFLCPVLRLLPVKKKWVVFESMWGSKYSCNPRYLYEYIDKNHPDYTCIWSFKDEHTPIEGKGVRVRRQSLKYLYYMARAKYFVNNVNFEDAFVKRKNQVEVQTMHGTPLKTIGLDVPGDFPTKKSVENYVRKCKRWDYLIVQSKFVADLAPSAFKFNKEYMNTGYPRTDILYHSDNPEAQKAMKKKLGLPEDKKIIMYAPTWRVKNRFDLMLDLEKMREKFSDEYALILRLHHFSAKNWEGVPEDGFVYDLTDYQSIEDLYTITDILITDYSSVMFDYAVLNRPMLFFTYDLENYRDNLRGFNIDIETESPGPVLFTSDEVINAIENLDDTIAESKERVDAFNKKYIEYECGQSSEKVFEIMTNH